MKDSSLLRLSITCSILGILLLLLLNPQPNLTKINEINQQHLNKNIQIQGKLIKATSLEKLTILTIKDSSGTIQATTFQTLDLKPNTKLTIDGKVTEYKEKLQLQTNKIII